MDRVRAIGSAYLRWLCRADEESQRTPPPLWNEFLSDQDSIVDGHQVTEDELREIMPWLKAHQMIGGGGIAEINFPVRVLLTEIGRICLMDHGGDVRAFAVGRSGGVSNSVFNFGNHNQIAANSKHTSQIQAGGSVDVTALRRAADQAREILPHAGLPAEQGAEAMRVAAEIVTEADSPRPDHRKLRTLAEQLKTWLPLATSMLTSVASVETSIHQALGK